VEPARDAVGGEWRREGGVLRGDGTSQDAALVLPHEPRGEYDLRIRFARLKEDGIIAIHLPAFQGSIGWQMANYNKFHVFTWFEKGKSGSQFSANVTEPVLEKDRVFSLEIKVRRDRAEAWMDGRKRVEWKPTAAWTEMHFQGKWHAAYPGRIALTMGLCAVAFHSVELEAIPSGTVRVETPPPPVPVPPARPGRVDLLALVDTARDAVRGQWRREGGILRGDGASADAVLAIPYEIGEEYDLRVRFARLASDGGVAFNLPALGGSIGWQMGNTNRFHLFSAIRESDGGWQKSEVYTDPVLEKDRVFLLEIKIRRQRAEAWIDGRRIVEWQPAVAWSQLIASAEWKGPYRGRIGLTMGLCAVVFHSVELEGGPAPSVPRLEVGQKDKDGWVCLFNGRDLAGWRADAPAPRVEDGALVLERDAGVDVPVAAADFELRGSYRLMNYSGAISFRRPDARRSGPTLTFIYDGDVHWREQEKALRKTGPRKFDLKKWQSFHLRVVGDTVALNIEGVPLLSAKVSRLERGDLNLYAVDAKNAGRIDFKDLCLRELGRDGNPLDARPWRNLLAEGRTADQLFSFSNGWRLEGNALVAPPGVNSWATTRESFMDGELRLRFEGKEIGHVYFSTRVSAPGVHQAMVMGDELGKDEGRPHEIVFSCRGAGVTATLDGRPLPLKESKGGIQGALGIGAQGASVRILSVDYRELP
jgi:hypothetical protein